MQTIRDKRALVLGGKGFIGTHLRGHLIASGASTARSFDKKDDMDILKNRKLLSEAIRSSDVVFGCAGILGTSETFDQVHETIDVNIHGTVAVLELCQRHSVPFIYLSLKTDWYNPYLITKRAANEFCLMWNQYLHMPVAVVRGLNVYGPGQKWMPVRKAVPNFIVNALRNEPLEVYGQGEQITDQIFVDDLCEALVRVYEHNAYGMEIDVGTGVPITVKQLASLIIYLADSTSKVVFSPMRIGEPRTGGVQLADPSLMVQKLDYYPPTSLIDGMKRTVEWYREFLPRWEKDGFEAFWRFYNEFPEG